MTQEDAVPLVDPERDNPSAVALMLARAQAIQAYANLEQSLFMVFTGLLMVPPEAAGAIFFNVVNTRSRNDIVGKLLKQRHGSTYNVFWNSLVSLLRNEIDRKRNEIVHWHVANEIKIGSDGGTSVHTLNPPNFWSRSADKPKITTEDMLVFVEKCGFISRHLNMFHVHLLGKLPPSPWPEVFQQAIAYPPPDTHPFSPNYKEPEVAPPQPQV